MPSLNRSNQASKLLCLHNNSSVVLTPQNSNYLEYFFLLQSVNLFQFVGIDEESRDFDDQLSSTFGLRDRDDSSTLREFVGNQAMSTRTQILVLGLAVGLLHGCAHFPMTLVRSVPTPVESTQEKSADSLSPQSSLAV